MTDTKELNYTPQEDRTFIYTVALPVTETKVFTGVLTSDAPDDITEEILLQSFKETSEEAEMLDFREASEEEIAFFHQNIDETIN